MRKKLFSILALLLTVCSAWADGDIRVYFTDALNWGDVKVYYWSDGPEWPGTAMTLVGTDGSGNNVYEASIPDGVTGIIFNDGKNSKQTPDITTGIENGAWWKSKDGGSVSVEKLTLEGKYIFAATVTGVNNTDWTGSEIHPVPVVTLGGNVLSSTNDYGVTYSDGCTNVGTYTVTITGKNDYVGTRIVNFNINNAYFLVGSFNEWQIDQSYKLFANPDDGNEYCISGLELSANDDFKVKSATEDYFPGGYDDNYVITAAGTYDIYFRPNYDGGDDWYYNCIYVADVTPERVDISAATVTGINASYDWTGSAIKPVPVVTLDGNVLSSTTDYDVTYSDGCTNVGSYNVTITGKNDYTGTIEKSFNINDVFYLVGSMNNWEINQNYKLVKNEAAETEEYFIKIVQFASGDQFKVASPGRKTEWDGATWYPDGMENNYVISNVGIYDIYFRPNGDGGSDWHEGYIYAAESVGGFDVALAPTGYGTFYCEDYEATLPSGVVAYIVTDATPTYEVIADGDGETKTIPAGTAVLLYSASKPSNVTLSLDLTGSTTDDRTFTNLLDGSDVETQTDTDAAKYYKLTYGNDNTTFGWFWGADNGGVFTSPAHKAWLALPASAGARAFFNLPGEENTTGIATIENKQQKADNVWYDLNGRRINAPKTKGIYVKDGRKLVIK